MSNFLKDIVLYKLNAFGFRIYFKCDNLNGNNGMNKKRTNPLCSFENDVFCVFNSINFLLEI